MAKDIRILNVIEVYRDGRFYSSFPATVRLPTGKLLVAFRRARDHRWLKGPCTEISAEEMDAVDHVDSRSHLATVEIDPQDWSIGPARTLSIDPQAGDQDPSLTVLRSGRLLLGGFGWYPVSLGRLEALQAAGIGMIDVTGKRGGPYIFWGGYTRISDDGGRSWTEHAPLPPLPGFPDLVPGRKPLHGGAVRGRPVQLDDGTVLLATYTNRPGTALGMSFLFASNDDGATWTYRSTIAEDTSSAVGLVEPTLVRCADGRLLALHRTQELDDKLVVSTSRDDGRSWEPWVVHDVLGHPHDVCPLPDGRVLLVYGYRHEPYGVRARLWDPLAQKPEDAAEFVIRDDAPSPDVGYPWACVAPDGTVFVAYYIADDRGVRHIAASVLEIR